MKELHIDARMIGATGIGTYLYNILSRASVLRNQFSLVLHGPPNPLQSLSDNHGLDAKIVPLAPEPYALLPTLVPFGSFSNVENLWVPHYNAPLLGVKNLVATVHDVLHLREGSTWLLSPQRLYARLVFTRLRACAKHIIFDSKFSADEFDDLVAPPRSSSVIPIGVDPVWSKLRGTTGSEVYRRPYLLYVGNHRRHKNLALLLESYLRLPEEYPWDLVIIGPSDIRNADAHPLLVGESHDPRVHVLGKVSFEVLCARMRDARALVFPSSYEGFGLPPLEALAAGTPVLASDIPVLREVLGTRVDYFPLNDADGLLTALHKIQGQKPQIPTLDSHNWEDTTSATFEIFRDNFGR